MAIYLEAVRNMIQAKLKDKTQDDFEPSDIDEMITLKVFEISKAKPYEVIEAITLTSGSLEYDVSSIANLISVRYAEYPTGRNPKVYKNVTRFGDTIEIVNQSLPSGSQSANLYCHKVHTIDENSTTLSPDLIDVLVNGACADLASGWARRNFSRVVWGGSRTAGDVLNWATQLERKYQHDLKVITKQRRTQVYSDSNNGLTEIGGW